MNQYNCSGCQQIFAAQPPPEGQQVQVACPACQQLNVVMGVAAQPAAAPVMGTPVGGSQPPPPTNSYVVDQPMSTENMRRESVLPSKCERLPQKATGGNDYIIFGADSQIVEIKLEPGQHIVTEPGTMNYLTDGIQAALSIGSCWDACLRSCCAGEHFCRAKYENKSSEARYIGLTPEFPAKVVPVNLNDHPEGFVIKNQAFMAAYDENVKVNYKFAGFAAGCCGGQGCCLNTLSGSNEVFLNAGGTIIIRQLAEGEEILADGGSVVGFSSSVAMKVKRTGGACMMCCAGEGLTNTKLKGPGLVIIQSMSFERVRNAIVMGNQPRQNTT